MMDKRSPLMKHRHLNNDDLTLAAIDSIIERGTWRDWMRLARTIRKDAQTAERVYRLATARIDRERENELFPLALFVRWQQWTERLRITARISESGTGFVAFLSDGQKVVAATTTKLAYALFDLGIRANTVHCGDWREPGHIGTGSAIALKRALRQLAESEERKAND